MVWQQDNLIYYNDFVNKFPNYEVLKATHRIQNCHGLSLSIGALVHQIHPDNATQFRNFRTKEYQFNLLELPNGLKFILITSVRPDEDDIDSQMGRIHKAYLDLVKRNYFYQHGSTISNPKFDQAVTEILFSRS